MSTDAIQARYDQLDRVAGGFAKEHFSRKSVRAGIRSSAIVLHEA